MSDKSVVLMMKYTQFFFYFSLTGKVKCQGLAWVVQNNLANQGSCEMLLFFGLFSVSWVHFCFTLRWNVALMKLQTREIKTKINHYLNPG